MSLVLNEENKAALLDKVYIVWLGDRAECRHCE